MKVLSSIPFQLRGRGHNECTPMECGCGSIFLFPLSDGLRSDGDLDDETVTVPVKCPGCESIFQLPPSELISHNGQVK